MNTSFLEPAIFDELKTAAERGLASGDLLSAAQIAQQTILFQDRFGPAVLRNLDGDALLKLMHGRETGEAKCLAYWLEFKDDDEFAGNQFGRIGGGAALKFGIYQRKSDGAWMAGSSTETHVLSLQEAISKAKQQRDELLAGDEALAVMDANDISDEVYSRLQSAMEKAAPTLSNIMWAHKYWFLLHRDRLDNYHSPRYQRFHLFKMLQIPPDSTGILDGGTPRFVCAGRFVGAAQALAIPVATLTSLLNQRDGALHRYWRVGTTEGHTGESHWAAMRDGSFVSIGWPEQVPNLSDVIGQKDARDRIRDWLLPMYSTNPATGSRKAGEILKFAQEIAENDLVLACDGQTVLGVGKIRGTYEYDGTLAFPHRRPVEWLLLDPWQMPEKEGLLTTVWELGKSPVNLLELEQRLFRRGTSIRKPGSQPFVASAASLAPLDSFAARIDAVLRRKGQVVFYGPPGTGKTFRALAVTKELAARHAFHKTFAMLTEGERTEITGDAGLVRLCTFHPGYGYEDFIEGLRPRTAGGQMMFEPRDGIFKKLCADAAGRQDRNFFLVVDEMNRGDVPRIFGELMTIIEHDKRGMSVALPVSGKAFSVPKNVFLIGTMNTADRSISLLDAALRRRFGFVELMPDSTLLTGHKAGSIPLGPWLDALNMRVRKHIKRDARNLQVGHAYLLSSPPITSAAEFARVLRDDIIPLLEEYCYDDFDTLREILGKSLVDADVRRIREEIFDPNREEDLIQAVSFEEMQPIILAQGVSIESTTTENDDASAETTENEGVSES